MKKYKNPIVIFSILLAVILPIVSAVSAHKAQKEWPVVKFLIEPYDPRDLLYGHYLQFQIKWNWKKDQGTPQCHGEECCLCVGQGDYNPQVSVTSCSPEGDTLLSCNHIIKGSYYGGFAEKGMPPVHNFTTNITRYYVDESLAMPLEKLFTDKKEEFALGLAMSPKGRPVIEQLYIGKKAINDYLAAHGGNLKAPPEEIPVTP